MPIMCSGRLQEWWYAWPFVQRNLTSCMALCWVYHASSLKGGMVKILLPHSSTSIPPISASIYLSLSTLQAGHPQDCISNNFQGMQISLHHLSDRQTSCTIVPEGLENAEEDKVDLDGLCLSAEMGLWGCGWVCPFHKIPKRRKDIDINI